VPLGVSAHSHEPELREHTRAEADAVLDAVERWQARYLDALGRRLVFAADEYYLMADRPFPDTDAYEGFLQHENGIGMARTFEREVAAALQGADVAGTAPRAGFFASVEGAPAAGYRAPRTTLAVVDAHAVTRQRAPVAIVTGEYGARVLAPLIPTLEAAANVPVRLLPVANRFFGGNIAVTGLLTAADVAATLVSEPADHRYLLPDVVLSDDRFLDGGRVADLPRPVEVVGTTGADLVRALT
jgi:NifB/MoaA-like Fe-S oxidoreductase